MNRAMVSLLSTTTVRSSSKPLYYISIALSSCRIAYNFSANGENNVSSLFHSISIVLTQMHRPTALTARHCIHWIKFSAIVIAAHEFLYRQAGRLADDYETRAKQNLNRACVSDLIRIRCGVSVGTTEGKRERENKFGHRFGWHGTSSSSILQLY